jgi:hypothetical protein
MQTVQSCFSGWHPPAWAAESQLHCFGTKHWCQKQFWTPLGKEMLSHVTELCGNKATESQSIKYKCPINVCRPAHAYSLHRHPCFWKTWWCYIFTVCCNIVTGAKWIQSSEKCHSLKESVSCFWVQNACMRWYILFNEPDPKCPIITKCPIIPKVTVLSHSIYTYLCRQSYAHVTVKCCIVLNWILY